MQRLRIAVIAPPWFTVPPSGYGGTELVVSYLVDGLVRNGHEVTLFASGGSRTAARLVSPFADPPSHLLGDALVEGRHLLEAYRRHSEFDLVHDHTPLGLLAATHITTPVVHTVHGSMNARTMPFYASLPDSPNLNIAAVSEHQRSTLPRNLDATVVYNGVDPRDFPYSAQPGDYLLFVGRMSPEKGVIDAIEISRRTGIPLRMIVKVNESYEQEYFDEVVRPAMRGADIDLMDQPPFEAKAAAYRDALATLFPIHWPEPFGLVMIESMAAGTPVVAFREGSVPEVIVPGVTGQICANIDEAVAGVLSIQDLDRRACRELVERRFSAAENVRRYEALYALAFETAGSRLTDPLETLRVPLPEEPVGAGLPSSGADGDQRVLASAADR